MSERHHCGRHNLLHDGPDCPRCPTPDAPTLTIARTPDGLLWAYGGDGWRALSSPTPAAGRAG